MRGLLRLFWPGLAAVMVTSMVAACAPASSGGGVGGTISAPATNSPSLEGPRGTLRIAWAGEPPSLSPKMVSPGGSAFNELSVTFNSALTYYDPAGNALPQIAREIPTTDNGGWVVNADGTMVTTYNLRENAKWHDGTPLTARDFVFAFDVYKNPEVPIYRRNPEVYMSSIEAKDPQTLVINWKQPYYRANALRYTQLDPLPSHLLEDTYRQDVSAFVNGPFWTGNYVGSGPFRVERWEPGVAITARAHMDWVLGSPKAATLEIHEVPDWQSALADSRVRQAVLSSIDREGLAELLNFGLGGSSADMFMMRNDPIFPEVNRAIARYPLDATRAARLFADAGWRRATPDGVMTNASGQPFTLEVRATAGPAGEQETAFIANNWKAVGVEAGTFLVPRALASDPQIDTIFPGGQTSNRPITPENFSWTSAQIPTAQSRWLGQNRGSFSDSEVDRAYDALLTSTNPRSWLENSTTLHKRMSEMLGTLPLYYPADVIVARNPIKGPAGHFTYPCYSWNIFEWGE